MATKSDGIAEERLSEIEEGITSSTTKIHKTLRLTDKTIVCCSASSIVTITQKFIAEVIGTYFVIFAGCGSVAVNKTYGEVTFPGVCVTWGLIVMVMVYTVGHISGAHFNPAVTITSAVFRRFPYREVPVYIVAQLMGSILASGTLALVLDLTPKSFFGTVPVGSNGQSLVMEIVISFLLMFVISGVTTDDRAISEFGGLAVGMTILLNVFVAGPISGASMNPARSLGPAIVNHAYKGLWVYIAGPIIGTLAGALAYNVLRFRLVRSSADSTETSGSLLKSTFGAR